MAETVPEGPSAGASGQDAEIRKERERTGEASEAEHPPRATPGGSQDIDFDLNDLLPDDGMNMVVIPNEDMNNTEEEENDIAETAAPNEIVEDYEDKDDDQLDLIDPSDGNETDIDPFDKDFAPSDDDEDEEVGDGPEYDPLDYDLPDFDDI